MADKRVRSCVMDLLVKLLTRTASRHNTCLSCRLCVMVSKLATGQYPYTMQCVGGE